MSDAPAAAPEDAAKDKDKAPAAAKGGKKKLLIIIASAVIALGAAGGGAFFFMNKGHADDEEAVADSDEGEHDAKEEKGKSKDKKGKKGKAAEPKAPAIYVELDPPFVVNFERRACALPAGQRAGDDARPRDRRDDQVSTIPKIRNDLLLLLGNQTYDTISTREGKEQLRERGARGRRRRSSTSEGGKAEKRRGRVLHQLRDAVTRPAEARPTATSSKPATCPAATF